MRPGPPEVRRCTTIGRGPRQRRSNHFTALRNPYAQMLAALLVLSGFDADLTREFIRAVVLMAFSDRFPALTTDQVLSSHLTLLNAGYPGCNGHHGEFHQGVPLRR